MLLGWRALFALASCSGWASFEMPGGVAPKVGANNWPFSWHAPPWCSAMLVVVILRHARSGPPAWWEALSKKRATAQRQQRRRCSGHLWLRMAGPACEDLFCSALARCSPLLTHLDCSPLHLPWPLLVVSLPPRHTCCRALGGAGTQPLLKALLELPWPSFSACRLRCSSAAATRGAHCESRVSYVMLMHGDAHPSRILTSPHSSPSAEADDSPNGSQTTGPKPAPPTLVSLNDAAKALHVTVKEGAKEGAMISHARQNIRRLSKPPQRLQGARSQSGNAPNDASDDAHAAT